MKAMLSAIITITITPIASPSKPSVKFTAFDVAVIMNTTTGIYRNEKSRLTFFRNGTVVNVL